MAKFPKLKFSFGFTFIELIMVMLIISIAFAIMMSPKEYLSNIRTQEAAQKIKSDIAYAQSYALSAQLRTMVLFNASTESYSVYVENTPGSWSLLANPLTKDSFIVNLQDDYSGVNIVQTDFDGTNLGVAFDNAGQPYSCSSGSVGGLLSVQGTVTLNSGITVRVEPRTGKVSIG